MSNNQLIQYYVTPLNQATTNHEINQIKPMPLDKTPENYYTTDNPSGWYFDLGESVAGRPVYKKYHVGCVPKITPPKEQTNLGRFDCKQPHWCPHCN